MTGEGTTPHVAYRAVLLAAGLLLFGLLFRQLTTLMLAVLVTIVIAIPLSAAATRLERYHVPRAVGALLALFGGIAALALVIYLLIPPFVDQTNEFVDDVPGIVRDLEGRVGDVIGSEPSEVGDRVQHWFESYTDEPERLIGPITSIGLNVAGVVGALVLILITAYYMAVRPGPLVEGLVSLAPPARRDHVRHVLDRVRQSWIGWMEGVAIDMAITGVFTYVALTDSPGKALLVLGAYILVQQLESNVTMPVIMSQRVRLHPAMIAIGVLVVGRLFGFVGLFVAVPILSLITICVQEFWVKELDRIDRDRARPDIALPGGTDELEAAREPSRPELVEAEGPVRPAS